MKAVALAPELPKTIDDLEEGEILRIPATWEEYLELIDKTPYTIQFLDGEIIIMSQATDTHERLVARLIKLFAIYFDELDDFYQVLGSNVKIVTPGQKGDFNADLSVVRGPSEYGPTPKGRDSRVRIINPYIVVEVLSKGTRRFDMSGKLLEYQTVPSLQYVVFIDQQAVNAWVYARTDNPDQWLQTHYHNLTNVITIDEFRLPLADVYRKIDVSK